MQTRRATLDDYLALPADGKQVEFVEGEIVVNPSPSPDHQGSSRNLLVALHLFVTQHGSGVVYAAPLGVRLADDIMLEPDLLFVCEDRRSILERDWINGAPDLVIEIASPSTRVFDAVRKRALYGKHGVREFWIVDPEIERVEVYVLSGLELVLEKVVEQGEVRSHVALPGFSIPLRSVFMR